jgi:predicted PurR-regulated permease PerM
MDRQIVITLRTVLLFLVALAAGYIIYRLGPVFAVILVAGLIVLSLEPLVKFFMGFNLFNKPISRGFAVLLTYVSFLTVIITVFTIGLPPVFTQAQKLLANLPILLASLTGQEVVNVIDFLPQLADLPRQTLGALTVGLSSLATIFSVFILSIYMSLDWDNIKKRFFSLFSDRTREEVTNIVHEVETNIGHWVKGEVTLMIVIGLASFIGLSILGIEFALALALIAGILEIVPILGPVVSAILASIVGFADSPIKGLAVLGLFIIIQQLENSLLVPKIMQRVSGFSPLVILIALLVGHTFFGLVGALIAVPTTMVGVVIVRSILKHTATHSS